MSTFFIIDTNAVVAGLLTAHADSPVARILDGMLCAAFPFVVSEALLAEYHAVLMRPRLTKLHGLSVADIDTVLAEMARHAIVLNPVPNAATPLAPDAGEQFLWDLLATRADLLLVSGDKLLLQNQAMSPRVITSQACIAQWQH